MASDSESRLEVMVSAALDGYDLGPFEPVDGDGYQARCCTCGRTVYVGENGFICSLLEKECSATMSPN